MIIINVYLISIRHFFTGKKCFKIKAINKKDAVYKAYKYAIRNYSFGGNFDLSSIKVEKKLNNKKKERVNLYTIETCPHLRCNHCKYYNAKADLNSEQSKCKRIDHKKVKFAKPWFASYDCSIGYICRDFIPKHFEYADLKEWTNFDDYWNTFKQSWLDGVNIENEYIAFILNNNSKVRYYVRVVDFINNTFIKDGKLLAVKKRYYKKTKQGYKLITEELKNGVELNG